MDKRRGILGGPIWLLVSMYRKDPMVFYIFAVGVFLFAFASALVVLMDAP